MSSPAGFFFRSLSLLLLAAAVSCAVRPMPEYQKNPNLAQAAGTLAIPGLQAEVQVYRDRWGVPHIFAANEHDLFVADGFLQAQDRLWQIMLFRAASTGRLAEIFGRIGVPEPSVMGMQLDTVAMDRRMRTMGMNYIGVIGVPLLAKTNPRLLAQMQAFCDGINFYLRKNRGRLPIEFQVLGYEPDDFSPADVISLSRFYGSNLCANLDMELLRYGLAKKYGAEVAWKLLPLHESLGPTVVPREMLHNRLPAPRPLPVRGPDPAVAGLSGDAAFQMARSEMAFHSAALFPTYYASNNWVVGPKLTATGTAMFANDPHLVHIEPSLCYAMHLMGAGIDAYGVAFPGSPYIVMGHTRKLSWGATVTSADVQDLFVETVDPKNHPGQYLYKGEWKDFAVRKETIKVRPGIMQTRPARRYQEIEIEIRSTVHGPVMNDAVGKLPKGTPPLALRWTGHDFSRDPQLFVQFITSTSLDDFKARLAKIDFTNIETINVGMMFDQLMRAQSVNDFVKAQSYNELLNMNWVAADADGHIAYLPGGLVPIRRNGTGTMPVPGEKGDYDWTGFIPLLETPHAIDPERGYMASANNQVVEAEWYPYIFGTNYDDGWRAWRIEELIQKLSPITIDDMRAIQNDVYVKQAEVFVPLILQAVKDKKVRDQRLLKAAEVLRTWNLQATIDSPAPSIFYETMHALPDRVLQDDFDGAGYRDYIRGNATLPVQMWIIKGQCEYCDDRCTKNRKEDGGDMLVAALGDAVKALEKNYGKDMLNWQWGKLHTIKWYHPMGFLALKDMSIGPYPHPGGGNTVRNAGYFGVGGKYRTFGGPVMRHIMDMGDPDNALLVIDGSESGQWLSPHYRDQHTLWYNSQYMTARMKPELVQAEAESLLTLTPGN